MFESWLVWIRKVVLWEMGRELVRNNMFQGYGKKGKEWNRSVVLDGGRGQESASWGVEEWICKTKWSSQTAACSYTTPRVAEAQEHSAEYNMMSHNDVFLLFSQLTCTLKLSHVTFSPEWQCVTVYWAQCDKQASLNISLFVALIIFLKWKILQYICVWKTTIPMIYH